MARMIISTVALAVVFSVAAADDLAGRRRTRKTLVISMRRETDLDGNVTASASSGLSPTAVGVLIVGVVVVLALAGILWWFIRRKPKRRQQQPAAARRRTAASPRFDDAPAGMFLTAFSPPSSSYDKPVDAFHSGGGFNIDARANRDGNPRMQAPTQAPYVAYGRADSIVPSFRHEHQRARGGEPLLYNREATTTLRVTDSTRSYLYEPTTPTDPDAADRVEATPKIFSSNNSVDFTYADTDRSNLDLVDSTPTALRDVRDLHHDTSRRSDDSDSYGFVVQTNDSVQIFSSVGDDDSCRSSRPYTDDSARSPSRVRMLDETLTQSSGRPFSDEASARTTAYREDTETNALSTQELRHIKVEL
jgi:hypothetical protein